MTLSESFRSLQIGQSTLGWCTIITGYPKFHAKSDSRADIRHNSSEKHPTHLQKTAVLCRRFCRKGPSSSRNDIMKHKWEWTALVLCLALTCEAQIRAIGKARPHNTLELAHRSPNKKITLLIISNLLQQRTVVKCTRGPTSRIIATVRPQQGRKARGKIQPRSAGTNSLCLSPTATGHFFRILENRRTLPCARRTKPEWQDARFGRTTRTHTQMGSMRGQRSERDADTATVLTERGRGRRLSGHDR